MLGSYSLRFIRVIEFNQGPWMKTFIDFNLKKRRESKNEFEKDSSKLCAMRLWSNLHELEETSEYFPR